MFFDIKKVLTTLEKELQRCAKEFGVHILVGGRCFENFPQKKSQQQLYPNASEQSLNHNIALFERLVIGFEDDFWGDSHFWLKDYQILIGFCLQVKLKPPKWHFPPGPQKKPEGFRKFFWGSFMKKSWEKKTWPFFGWFIYLSYLLLSSFYLGWGFRGTYSDLMDDMKVLSKSRTFQWPNRPSRIWLLPHGQGCGHLIFGSNKFQLDWWKRSTLRCAETKKERNPPIFWPSFSYTSFFWTWTWTPREKISVMEIENLRPFFFDVKAEILTHERSW